MKNDRLLSASTAVILVVECGLYAAFLTLDILGRGSETIPLKYAAILLCLLLASLTVLRGGDRLILPALTLTAAADLFLLVLGRRLILGVLLFLCVQTIYLLRLRRLGAPSAPLLRAGLALLAGLALFLLEMATPLTLLAGLYFSQLLSNTILAWTTQNRWFAAGLTLFVGCDVCVGLFNSGLLSGWPYRFALIGMWLFYLPSQILIVLSALPKEVPHENQ